MTQERAVLAGGCFWEVQDLIRRLPAVISTRVGYTGGDVDNATYRNHGTHAEAIEITFDPQRTSYRNLLEFFFEIHDPTTRNRQGNDVGASYRSAVFYTSDEQKRVAEDTIADVDASGLWPGKVVTELVPVGPFWQAEPEHQDYLERVPNGYTCHFVRPNWKLPMRTQLKSTGRDSGQGARIPRLIQSGREVSHVLLAACSRGSSRGFKYSRPNGPTAVTCVTYSPDFAQWKWNVSPGRTTTEPGG